MAVKVVASGNLRVQARKTGWRCETEARTIVGIRATRKLAGFPRSDQGYVYLGIANER